MTLEQAIKKALPDAELTYNDNGDLIQVDCTGGER